jgi:hypothetical protein
MRCLIPHWNIFFGGYKINIQNFQFGVFFMEVIRFQNLLAKTIY